ncbi:PTS sugar transporter subunit IIA [Paludibacterium yongneupense]|uniref:PTS sugar transporter subunit IIA n=1 Tax=Paludibacterium yongneupense TaxID=400061 RepID=UPI000401AA40|nr:PTS sugar transporter subunit IIA [Paludibacterium yongneupense]
MNLIDQLLARDTILLQGHAGTWQQAVRLGVDLLVEAGCVEERYYDSIIAMTGELGPWYLLAPGMAMPHARPEEGVLKNGFALVTLETPVVFGDPDNDPVDILITLAATDARTMNEQSIVEVVTLLDDEARVERLRQVRTRDELLTLFNEIQG